MLLISVYASILVIDCSPSALHVYYSKKDSIRLTQQSFILHVLLHDIESCRPCYFPLFLSRNDA